MGNRVMARKLHLPGFNRSARRQKAATFKLSALREAKM